MASIVCLSDMAALVPGRSAGGKARGRLAREFALWGGKAVGQLAGAMASAATVRGLIGSRVLVNPLVVNEAAGGGVAGNGVGASAGRSVGGVIRQQPESVA